MQLFSGKKLTDLTASDIGRRADRKRQVNPSSTRPRPAAYFAATHGHGARVHNAEVGDAGTANGWRDARHKWREGRHK